MKCQVAEIQWGGGVVAEIFCGLQTASRFSGGGGGGSSRNFLRSPNGVAIQWGGGGGVVAEIFCRLQTASRLRGGVVAPPESATDYYCFRLFIFPAG